MTGSSNTGKTDKTGTPGENNAPCNGPSRTDLSRQQSLSGFRAHRPKKPGPVQPVPMRFEPKPTGSDEVGGYDGPEPTRFGDWQHKGRVSDF